MTMRDDERADEGEEPLADLRREVETRSEDDAEPDDRRSGTDESSANRPPDDSDGDAGGPLEDLRRDVESRADADQSADPDPTVDERFAEMGVEDVDSEDLWADLLLDDGPTEGSFPPSDTAHRSDGTYHEVTKRLCHRCEYFGDPPTLHCTHEGTTIHELVDMDHYLVSECPMVEADDDTGESP
ncbi:MAG: hypothetical protein ACOCUA_02830 [archaeon]